VSQTLGNVQSPLLQFVRPDGYGGTIKFYWAGGADTPRLEFRYQSDSAFISVWAAAFTVNSDRAEKKNIRAVKGGMLDLVLQAKPSRYRRKAPKGVDTPDELGFIWQELPEGLRTGSEETGAGVNLYSLTTAAIGAIQELSDRVKALEVPR